MAPQLLKTFTAACGLFAAASFAAPVKRDDVVEWKVETEVVWTTVYETVYATDAPTYPTAYPTTYPTTYPSSTSDVPSYSATPTPTPSPVVNYPEEPTEYPEVPEPEYSAPPALEPEPEPKPEPEPEPEAEPEYTQPEPEFEPEIVPPPPPPAVYPIEPKTPSKGVVGGLCSSALPCQGETTYYTAGLGACGETSDGESEDVIALPYGMMGTASNGNSFCGRKVKVTYNGKTATGTVKDKCMGCTGKSIDTSNHMFQQLAPFSVGRLHGVEWSFLD